MSTKRHIPRRQSLGVTLVGPPGGMAGTILQGREHPTGLSVSAAVAEYE
jgi:hypothetical protein